MESVDFWTSNQPGFKWTTATPGSAQFFADVERHRYVLEPHILEFARFSEWAGKDVLEVGCGIATDGVRFARAGARYVGIDSSHAAVELARRRFEIEKLDGSILTGSATDLPVQAASFDLLWSHGVIHHIEDTAAAVDEFHRVLRPGGVAIVMLYHRHSFNYVVTIMGLRRMLALSLLLPGGTTAVSKLTGEDRPVLEAHRELLRTHGRQYLADRGIFLSHNTDGPGNPLSKVYTRGQAAMLFGKFSRVTTAVRYLNLRLYPGGMRFASSRLGRTLGERFGWHLYVRAVK